MKQIVDFANGKETSVEIFFVFFVNETECTWHNTLAEVAC
jgi:hypothetical protein